jgi:hypothetical protein
MAPATREAVAAVLTGLASVQAATTAIEVAGWSTHVHHHTITITDDDAVVYADYRLECGGGWLG